MTNRKAAVTPSTAIKSSKGVFGTVPVYPVPVYRTELTKVSGTGIDVAPIPKRPVSVLMLYGTYRSVPYRYGCRTEHTEVSRTGIDVIPNLPKCPVPVLMSYRTHRSVRYR